MVIRAEGRAWRRTGRGRQKRVGSIFSRPTSLSAGGQTQTFAYDSCTNGLGRLCSVGDATGTTAYTYTPEGWIAGRGFSIGGTTYSLGYGYDALAI